VSDAGRGTPIRVEPRVRTRQQLAEAPARLVATLLSVATAGLLDAGRFRRGREYASSGAVTSLVVTPRNLLGTVMGSRREPYEVQIQTDLVPPPARGVANVQALSAITPDADEIQALCTCPDAVESVCKHAAAVLLAFAEETGDRPELLVTWRCGDVPAPDRATIGSRRWGTPESSVDRFAARARAARANGGSTAPPSPFATPAWLEYVEFAAEMPDADALVDALLTPAPDAPQGAGRVAPLGSERIGSFDLAGMVRSAQQAMCAASHDIV
jgi:hypothetical protein